MIEGKNLNFQYYKTKECTYTYTPNAGHKSTGCSKYNVMQIMPKVFILGCIYEGRRPEIYHYILGWA